MEGLVLRTWNGRPQGASSLSDAPVAGPAIAGRPLSTYNVCMYIVVYVSLSLSIYIYIYTYIHIYIYI